MGGGGGGGGGRNDCSRLLRHEARASGSDKGVGRETGGKPRDGGFRMSPNQGLFPLAAKTREPTCIVFLEGAAHGSVFEEKVGR